MLFRRLLNTTLVVFLAGAVNSAFAQDGHDHDHDHDEPLPLGAHVHGEAELFVVNAGGQLLIEFESPAMNLVGFEHAPHNDKQRSQVAAVAQQLLAVEQLFTMRGGDCQIKERHVEMPFDEHDHSSNQEEKANTGHDHHEKHGDHEEGSEHADVFAEYDFECANSNGLKGIEVQIFERFPALQKLNVQWSVPHSQSAQTLTADATYIQLQ